MRQLLAAAALALVAGRAAPTIAQPDATWTAAEANDRERAWLAERWALPIVDGWGTGAEYEGFDDEQEWAPERVDALPWPAPQPAQTHHVEHAPVDAPLTLSFDLAAITDLPFDLERVDYPVLLEFMEYYATEGRSRATRWLSASGRYHDAILGEIESRGAPVDLLWVPAIESGYTWDAVSRAGAAGLWQFMQRTAVGRGMRIDRFVDERYDPWVATGYAVDYLLDRYATFGSWPIALAAYNAGAGHVRGELRENNVTDFWVMDRYGCLYSDARRYALRIITIAIIARNPAAFGFEGVVREPALTWDELEVDGDLRLSLVAEAIGSDVETLRALNPGLRRPQTPPDVARWVLRVPPATAADADEDVDELIARYGGEHELLSLRFGETMAQLAERTGMSERTLRAINGYSRYERVPYRTEVIVPVEGRSSPPSSAGDEAAEPPVVLLPETMFRFDDRVRLFYEVNTGDTPAEIADYFGVGLYELAAWNDVDPRAALWSGMVLQVFVDADFDASDAIVMTEADVRAVALHSAEWDALQSEAVASQQVRRRTHTVGSGDTVIRIARRYGVRTSDIIRWNDLDDDGMIVLGQELVVGR